MSYWLNLRKKNVDARDKRGHDGAGVIPSHRNLRQASVNCRLVSSYRWSWPPPVTFQHRRTDSPSHVAAVRLASIRTPTGNRLRTRSLFRHRETEHQARLNLDCASIQSIGFEFPLAQCVLNAFALLRRRAYDVDVLHGAFGIDNDAHRNRHEFGTDRGGLNSLQQLFRYRVVLDAIRDRRAGIPLSGRGRFVHAERKVCQ